MGLGLCSLAADPELNLELGLIRSLIQKCKATIFCFWKWKMQQIKRDWEGNLLSSTELQNEEQNMFNMRVTE